MRFYCIFLHFRKSTNFKTPKAVGAMPAVGYGQHGECCTRSACQARPVFLSASYSGWQQMMTCVCQKNGCGQPRVVSLTKTACPESAERQPGTCAQALCLFRSLIVLCYTFDSQRTLDNAFDNSGLVFVTSCPHWPVARQPVF